MISGLSSAITLDASEVPHRATTGGKESVVVGHMAAHQCDELPFLVVKGSSVNMEAGTNVCLATRIARKPAFNINYFSESLVLRKLLQTMQVGDSDFPKDRHQRAGRSLPVLE